MKGLAAVDPQHEVQMIANIRPGVNANTVAGGLAFYEGADLCAVLKGEQVQFAAGERRSKAEVEGAFHREGTPFFAAAYILTAAVGKTLGPEVK